MASVGGDRLTRRERQVERPPRTGEVFLELHAHERKACRVALPLTLDPDRMALALEADVAHAGVVGAQQTSPTGFDTFYHACSPGNVCPAGPGETIVTPCGCLDTFPEAVVMMQTVRLAGADLACTATAR